MRNALFIANGIWKEKGSPGISGGDVRWIEIAKQWQDMGIDIHVLTTRAGVDLCKKLGLEASFHIIKAPDNYSLLSYMKRALRSFTPPKQLRGFNGIIYASSEHWYDVIPGAIIKRNNPSGIFVVVAHWVAPLRRKGTSLVNSFLFFINQRVGFKVTRKYADLILAVSEPTAQALKRIGMPIEKIKVVEAGVHYNKIREIVSQLNKKEFDGIFMKRFDGSKGVFDVIDIWEMVAKEMPSAKLILVGHGTRETYEKLRQKIVAKSLTNNVKVIGPIYKLEEKVEILAKSKIFLLPSYEENWAIVIGEAMAAGVPVVAYDLPEIRRVWKDTVIWIPKGNKRLFATKVIELLNNESLRTKIVSRGISYVEKYDWKEIAKKELELVLTFYSSQQMR